MKTPFTTIASASIPVSPRTDDQVCNFVTIAEVPPNSEVGSEMLELTIFVKLFLARARY